MLLEPCGDPLATLPEGHSRAPKHWFDIRIGPLELRTPAPIAKNERRIIRPDLPVPYALGDDRPLYVVVEGRVAALTMPKAIREGRPE